MIDPLLTAALYKVKRHVFIHQMLLRTHGSKQLQTKVSYPTLAKLTNTFYHN
jgi:hypothetical protein